MSRMRGPNGFPLLSKPVMTYKTSRTVCKFLIGGFEMYYVGIDIAKRVHEAVIIDASGVIIYKSIRFSNNREGYETLIQYVNRVTSQRNQLVFGMESTSHYWLPLYSSLSDSGYRVHVLNPIQSNSMRHMHIRQTKTDTKDSLVIADVLRFGRFSETVVARDIQFALREMSRNRFYLTDCISDLKRKVTGLIDQIFPEYESLFSKIFLVSSIELLLKCPTPEIIRRTRADTITSLLIKHSNGHFGRAKALALKEAAQNSFGVPDACGVYSDLIRAYLGQIKFIQKQIDVLDVKINAIIDTLDTQITSIAGIGPILGATILAEIGDISRFKSADKLAAFAGIDPTVNQSGDFTSIKNHMSKRGSPYLRRALWMASVCAVQNDPMFRAYYDKKTAEGMKYMKIIGHCTKKMANVIFAVLRDNRPYVPVMNVPVSA